MSLRVAVIGVGAMGRNHARLYSELPDVELVGVADSNAETAETVARRCRTRAYTSYTCLLDELKPDAVTIAVPTRNHLEVALDVIQRGIHVLIEKPIARMVNEGREIVAAAEKYRVQLMVGHIERFNPAVIALRDHLANRELGRIFQIDAHRQGPFPSQVMDVGVVIDLAVHDLDVMRYLTGAELVRVYSETEQRCHIKHEDLLAAVIRLSDGTIGTLKINWLTPTKIRELFVLGECGMFRVDYLTQDLYFFENATNHAHGWDTMHVLRGVSEGRMIRHVVAKKEPLRAELEAFLASIIGKAPVTTTGSDGLKALEAAHALVRSGCEHLAISI
jgi:UDP-N-acetylglucosamine 3-dehydrogenase